MTTLSAQFDEMIIFGGVVFFYKIFEFIIYYVKLSYFIVEIPLTVSFLCLYVLSSWFIAMCYSNV